MIPTRWPILQRRLRELRDLLLIGHHNHVISRCLGIFKKNEAYVNNILLYIIGQYNPSARITAWLLTLMLCVLILYASGSNYSLISSRKDRFFRHFFMAGLFTLRVIASNMLRGNRQRNIFFHISF